MESFTAVFDGKVFVPDEPVALEPNVRVRLTTSPAPWVSKEERKAILERLSEENPAHSGGVDWAAWDRGDVYP